MSSSPPPFYDEFNGTFWLTFSASVFAFLGLCLRACLKSRCKTCRFCGIEFERDVAPPGQEPDIEINLNENKE